MPIPLQSDVMIGLAWLQRHESLKDITRDYGRSLGSGANDGLCKGA
jgi:hypothetical protein